MKRLYAIIGLALISSAISDLAFVALTCDGEKMPCTDFSANHPVIGLFLAAGSVLVALGVSLPPSRHRSV